MLKQAREIQNDISKIEYSTSKELLDKTEEALIIRMWNWSNEYQSYIKPKDNNLDLQESIPPNVE